MLKLLPTWAGGGAGARDVVFVSDATPTRQRPALALALLGVFLVGLNLRPAITAVAFVLGPIRSDDHLGDTADGLLTTIPLLAFMLLSTSAPRLGARVGIARAILWSMVLLDSAFAVRLLPGAGPLFVGMAIAGVAITVGNVLLPTYIKRYYPDRSGPLTATYTASLYLGAALAALDTLPLTKATGSWRLGLFAWVGLTALAIVAWLPHLRSRDSQDTDQTVSAASVRQLWTQPTAWAVTGYFAVVLMVFYTVSAWLPTILIDNGATPHRASELLAAVNVTAIPFTLVVALLVYRTRSQRWATTAGSVLLAAGLCGISFGPTEQALMWTLVFGAGHGAATGTAFSLPLLRTRNAQGTAALGGMSQTAGYAMAALGPVGAGALYDLTHSWTPLLVALIALIVFQGLAGLIAGRDTVLNTWSENER